MYGVQAYQGWLCLLLKEGFCIFCTGLSGLTVDVVLRGGAKISGLTLVFGGGEKGKRERERARVRERATARASEKERVFRLPLTEV